MEQLKNLTKYLRPGDVVRICADAGCTPRIYYQMLKLDSASRMTDAQSRAFRTLLKYVKQRQAEAAKITNLLSQISDL